MKLLLVFLLIFLSYFLFGDIRTTLTFEKPDDSKQLSVPLQRDYMTDDGTRLLSVLYAYFEKTVEAHVKFKISNVMSEFDLHGVIPVYFSSRVRMRNLR